MWASGFVALLAAGIGGGLTGSTAGVASLVTYPALLAFGLSPVGANVSNTVALVFTGAGSAAGSRPELNGQGHRIRRLLPLALMGGACGAVAVLFTPSAAFTRIVPWLIGAASLAIVVTRGEPVEVMSGLPVHDRRGLPAATLAVSFYGGYFGAAAGVVLLAVLLAATGDRLVRANAAKNVVLGLANLAGAVVFACFGPVRWTAVLPLGLGCLIGGRIGPGIVRRVPARPLRITIGVLGLGLAVLLGYRAYA